MRPTEYARKVIICWVLFLTSLALSVGAFIMLALLIETNQLVFMLLIGLFVYAALIMWQVLAKTFDGFGF